MSDVHVLHTTYRFVDSETRVKCPGLPRILEYMRCPRDRRMPDDLWEKLRKRVMRGPDDKRLFTTRAKRACEMAMQWDAVARMMHFRAKRDAVDSIQVLILRTGR